LEAGDIARIVESIVGMAVEYKKARMAFGERRGYRIPYAPLSFFYV